MSSRQGLVADIGGTNTRLALVENGRVLEETIARHRNRDFDTPEEAIHAFLTDNGSPACGSAVIAIAAPVNGEVIRMTNHSWTLDAACLGKVLGGAAVTFLNDFEALAYSLDRVAPERLKSVYGSLQAVPGNATRLVVGAGTGFNAAALFRSGGAFYVGTGECGHATLPVETEAELQLWKYLARGRGRASVERALSGAGLREIYEWNRLETGQTPEDYGPADIASLANIGGDPFCEAAARQWVTFLGRVTGDLALAFLSLGGIVLTGGVTRSLARFLAEPEFLNAFRAKGRQQQLVSGIPIHLLDDDFAALSGCAARM